MNDVISKNRNKFLKDLEKKLNERGYELVSYDFGSKRKHGTVTVKNPETQETVESTFSPKSNERAVKNLVTQIVKLFSGRGRRGQGEFKLSEDSPREDWFGVLKIEGLSKSIKALVDKIMSDGEIRSSDEIRDELEKHYASRKGDNTKRKRGTGAYIPSPASIKYYMSRHKSKYEKLNEYEFKWRGSNGWNYIFSLPIRG